MFLAKTIDDFACAVSGAVIDWDHQHLLFGIVHLHQCCQNVSDDLFFIVRGHENGDRRPVGHVDIDVGMALEPKEAIQREKVVPYRIYGDEDDDGKETVEHFIERRAPVEFSRVRLPALLPRLLFSDAACAVWQAA